MFFLQVIGEKGELRNIELGHPFLFSTAFAQEAVHNGDNRALQASVMGLGLATGVDGDASPVTSHA